MSRTTQDETAERFSQTRTGFRENNHFPCSAYHEQDWQTSESIDTQIREDEMSKCLGGNNI